MPNPSVFPKFPGPLGPSFRSFNLGAPERAIANLEGETNTLKNPNYLTALREKLVAQGQFDKQLKGTQSQETDFSSALGFFGQSESGPYARIKGSNLIPTNFTDPRNINEVSQIREIAKRTGRPFLVGADISEQEFRNLQNVFGPEVNLQHTSQLSPELGDLLGINRVPGIFEHFLNKSTRSGITQQSDTTELGQRLIGNIITSSGRGIRKSNEVIKRA